MVVEYIRKEADEEERRKEQARLKEISGYKHENIYRVQRILHRYIGSRSR